MTRPIFVATLAFAFASGALEAAGPDQAVGKLVARIVAPTPVLADLRELTDTIGGRPSGSPALERAVDWAAQKLKDAGVDEVRTESYVAPRVWVARVERAEILDAAASGGVLRAAAMPFSANTAAEGLEAEVADVGAGDDAGFALAGATKGKWVLVHSLPMRSIDDLFKEYLDIPPLVARVRASGASGILYMSTRPARLLYRHNLTLDGSLSPVPGILIEREGALRVARLLATGARLRVRAKVVADSPQAAAQRNVVAEIKGAGTPEETVILGAHLDSWDLGRGALDNGCNVAMIIDVARQAAALAKAGIRPRRTIRFSLYTGEEAGLVGSWGEVRNHRAELDRVKAQVIYDEGTGRTSGFSLGGREDLRATTDAVLAPVAALGPFAHTTDAFVGTDNYDYLVEGVPNLVANQDGPPYLPDYHAESDTYDKVDERELRANEAIAAVVTWGLADAETLPGRQRRAEVESVVKATGLDQQMRLFGLWDDFAAGRRGRMVVQSQARRP